MEIMIISVDKWGMCESDTKKIKHTLYRMPKEDTPKKLTEKPSPNRRTTSSYIEVNTNKELSEMGMGELGLWQKIDFSRIQ